METRGCESHAAANVLLRCTHTSLATNLMLFQQQHCRKLDGQLRQIDGCEGSVGQGAGGKRS